MTVELQVEVMLPRVTVSRVLPGFGENRIGRFRTFWRQLWGTNLGLRGGLERSCFIY